MKTKILISFLILISFCRTEINAKYNASKNLDSKREFLYKKLEGFEQAQKIPKLRPLISHLNRHAGCYIGDYTELSADIVYFNIDGKDEIYSEITDPKTIPKGYAQGFTNGKYKIFIKEIPGKKEGCLTENTYKILIIQKTKKYKYRLKGFCGC